MIPIKDENPTNIFPFITISIIFINIILFSYQISLGANGNKLVLQLGAIPYEITHFRDIFPPSPILPPLTLFSAMFIHGGLLHLGGNMLFLWIFGNNVEDYLGHIKFLFFYLISGVVASLFHILTQPTSTVPMIGASGAIAGVLGAYFILFPYARILTLVFFFFFMTTVRIPAVVFIGLWFVLQVLSLNSGGGIAWYAHIGGFLTGVMLVSFFAGKNKIRTFRHKRY